MERRILDITPAKNPFQKLPKIKACAYVRVSTSHTGQLDSLQNQTEYYERVITKNPNYEYCGIFSDAGISGAKEERPGFLAMMKKAKAGEIDLIFTKSISRFARNTLLLLKYVRELREASIGILFEEQKINTLSNDGELMLTVLGAIAEEERKSVCSNVRWSKRNNFKQGKFWVDTKRLLGYDKDKNDHLMINKEQAQIVTEIYQRYLNGQTSYQIAKAFNQEDVPTFSNYPWSQSKIIRIVSNEKYCGDVMMQKYYVDNKGIEKKNKGELAKYYIKDNHPAVISREDWEAVQKIRENRVTKYPYSKMLKCSYCGASLVHFINRNWIYWICNTKAEYGKKSCKGINLPERVLLEIAKETPIIEPMVVEEVTRDGSKKKRTKKDFRLIPLAKYQFK